MITFAQCARFAGLAPNEMILGASSTRSHEALLLSYLLNLHRGPAAVREMIVSDLRGFLDLGARDCAGDLLFVLRVFLSEYPEARRNAPSDMKADIIPFVLQARCRRQAGPGSQKLEERRLQKLIEQAAIAQRQMGRNRNRGS